MSRPAADRAQLGSLGSLLLVAVVVVSAGTFGAYYVASATSGAAAGAAGGADGVDLAVEVTQDELRIAHNGGESVSGSGFRVTVENASGEFTYTFADGAIQEGDGDDRLDAGETWRLTWAQSPGTDVTVTAVDTETDPGRLLLQDTTTIEQAATVRPGNLAQGEDSAPAPRDTGRPVVASVTVEDGPVINETEANASGQKVTVTFNESMDQSVDPTVTVTGLSGSPYTVDPTNGGFQSGTKWTGILDLADDDEEANATVEVSGAVDLAGNTQSPDPDTSNTIEVDTRAPSISAFEATNPDGQEINVTFESDENLSTISVNISEGGSVVKTLTADDFTKSGSGPYTYTATYTASGNGRYEATLNVAEDAAGNDGANGQGDSVQVNPGGGGPPGGGGGGPPDGRGGGP